MPKHNSRKNIQILLEISYMRLIFNYTDRQIIYKSAVYDVIIAHAEHLQLKLCVQNILNIPNVTRLLKVGGSQFRFCFPTS
jgi:hypothetical protein